MLSMLLTPDTVCIYIYPSVGHKPQTSIPPPNIYLQTLPQCKKKMLCLIKQKQVPQF